MKKEIKVCILVLICIGVIIFFPVVNTRSVSGNGEVLNRGKEKVGDCNLSVEITEVASLARCYSKRFSFVLDGICFDQFESTSYSETEDGLCLISQMCYDEKENSMELCSLIYPEELSYAVIRWNEKLYIIQTDPSVPYSELPLA